jgi:hypothetical protein
LGSAARAAEAGRMLRIDSAVAAALMHEPRASKLLWDAIPTSSGGPLCWTMLLS